MSEAEDWVVVWALVDENNTIGPAMIHTPAGYVFIGTNAEARLQADIVRSNLRQPGRREPWVEARRIEELRREGPEPMVSWNKAVPEDFLARLSDRRWEY